MAQEQEMRCGAQEAHKDKSLRVWLERKEVDDEGDVQDLDDGVDSRHGCARRF